MNTCRLYWTAFSILLILTLGISPSYATKQPTIQKADLPTDLKVARIFTHQAVLQRDRAIPVWGTCKPKDRVTVLFNGQNKTTKADSAGRWSLTLDATRAGGPYTLTISSKKQQLVLNDILIGDVFIAGGQSNMEWRLKQTVNNYKEEIANAKYPNIRYISITNNYAQYPQAELLDTFALWQKVSPETAPEMSAIAYFYARSLHTEFNIPIGIISSEWGGTIAEAWASEGALRAIGTDFDDQLAQLTAKGKSMLAFKEEAKKTLDVWIAAMRLADLGTVPENGLHWTDANYDPAKNSKWSLVKLPGKWESNGLPNYDGIVYYRTNFKLNTLPTGVTIRITLGAIDDLDSVWINGLKVGGTEGWEKPRNYVVPISLLKQGTNSIVVKVIDTGGDGGFTGDANEMKLFIDNNQSITLAGDWYYRVGTDNGKLPPKPQNLNTQNTPTVLFNAMINPIIPYGIKGAIWYQGESNATRGLQYRRVFPAVIKDWRSRWGQGDFPFLFVQLANYRAEDETPINSEWAELREAQTMTLSLPNTGMACTIDIGEANDIHPRNKQDVGQRLYLAAKKVIYGQNIVAAGPAYKSMEVKGNKVYLSFDNTDGKPLVIKDKYGYLKGFAVSDANNNWQYAKAEVVGQQVVVYADNVLSPIAVRYAWANNPGELDLYNEAGLPAVPFRTDNLPSITK